MYLSDYQKLARETAIYPASASVYYPALGLCGEAGEIANKIKKSIRGDGQLDAEKKAEVCKELGDVMWYCAAMASDVGQSLAWVSRNNPSVPTKNDIYDVVLELEFNAGLLANQAHCYRHNGFYYGGDPPDVSTVIGDRIGQVIYQCSRIAACLDTTLEEVCKENIAKLFKRKEAGTLKGNGDNR